MRWTRLAVVTLGVLLALAACSSGEDQGAATDAGGNAAEQRGNGIAEQSPEQIVAAAGAALQTATSVRLHINFQEGGEQTTFDGVLTQSGDSQIQLNQGDINAEIILAGGQTYMRSPNLWEQQGIDLSRLPPDIAERWVLVPQGAGVDVAGRAAQFGTIEGLAGLFSEEQLAGTSFEKADGPEVDGVPTVQLTDADGAALLIAAEGEPYPLRITPPDGGEQVLELSGYNEPAEITAPADALDLQSLVGQ